LPSCAVHDAIVLDRAGKSGKILEHDTIALRYVIYRSDVEQSAAKLGNRTVARIPTQSRRWQPQKNRIKNHLTGIVAPKRSEIGQQTDGLDGRFVLAIEEQACYTTDAPPQGVDHMPLVVMNTSIDTSTSTYTRSARCPSVLRRKRH
jgi:hypothetical protein